MKIGVIASLVPKLETIIRKRQDDIPPVLIMKFFKLIRKMSEEASDFIKAKNALIVKYAERDEKGSIIEENGSVRIQEGKVQEFWGELEKLSSQEVEADFRWFSEDEISSIKGIRYEDLVIMEPLIKFREEG